MKIPKGKQVLRMASAAVLAGSSLASLAFAGTASATPLAKVEVIFDNMQASAFTAGTVCASPTSTATEGQVDVKFPAGFKVSTTLANWTVNNTPNGAWPSGSTAHPVSPVAWPSIAAPAAAPTGQDVIFASGPLTVGSLYCFNWTNTTAALQQPTTAAANETGTVTTQTAGGTAIDSSQFATATLTSDTVNVTATVPPIFNFSVAPNSDPLGTLSTSAVTTSQSANRPALTVGTNAKNGWQIWGSDANGGLQSTMAGYTIASQSGTIAAGQESYNTGVLGTPTQAAGSTGTITVSSGWADATATSYTGVGLTTTPQTIATSNGTADTAVLTMINNVAIKSTTPAATDYTDTQTYIAAGLF